MFGKYKGKDLDWVARNNPGYIRWALEKGILKESDLRPQEIKHTEEYAEVKAEVEDNIAELWASTPEQYSTSRKVEDHELSEYGTGVFTGPRFPESISATRPQRRTR